MASVEARLEYEASMSLTRRSILCLACLASIPAHAIRPFITDDARVVGKHLLQLETWVQLEDGVLQNWVSPSFGPLEWLELSVGFVHGPGHIDGRFTQDIATQGRWGIGGPLLQAKALIRAAEAWQAPGVALAVGSLLPFGTVGFRAAPGLFAYVALTENLGDNERVLIHANLGIGSRVLETLKLTLLIGAGTQIRIVYGLHGVAELVYGDAYTGIEALAVQGGFRYIINAHVQLDATVGVGVAGQTRPPWFSAGVRVVSPELW